MSYPNSVSRRGVLGLLAAVAAGPLLLTRAAASRATWRRNANAVAASGLGRGYPRYLHAAVGLGDGRVVVIGGYAVGEQTRSRTGSTPTSSVQLYDPFEEEWYDLAPLQVPRARHSAVLLPSGHIAVMGGFHTSALSSVEIYDPRTNNWYEGDPLPMPMADHSASLCGDRIVLTGGQNGVPALLVPVAVANNISQP